MKRKINEFPDIDTSKYNIDENGNVLRNKRMIDKEFYSLRICPNCKHNNKRQAYLYLLHGKGKCWTCGEEMKNFTRSKLSKQKMKDFGVEE